MTTYDYLIIGAGIFGLTAAVELNMRGHSVALLDPGPIPHPLAASTDISKVVRMEYGADEQYMAMVEQAITGWHEWNMRFGMVYHQVGVTMLTRHELEPGDYEYESLMLLIKRGHRPDRLEPDDIRRRFPAWNADLYVDGFYHARGGYAESGRVIEALADKADIEGVYLRAGRTVNEIVVENGRCQGVHTVEGETFAAGHVIVAAGAWTHILLPELAGVMRASGHPVFHLKAPDRDLFSPPKFVVFTADITRSGWYGFPWHPDERVVKIANHGVGQTLHPVEDERLVTVEDEHTLRQFLAETFPALLDAPIVYTRRCLYSDTLDEHFWIDRHPEIAGLTVAAGGSGHAFKFAPILGGLIADAAEGFVNEWLPKFAWRDLTPETAGEEPARFHGGN
ncbi:MAG TPA: FAD-dependent oxidoreductase [Anaerolineae bacterium]|nr:FAD-dependent oxidoreductase [Anaerolineae bacterium]